VEVCVLRYLRDRDNCDAEGECPPGDAQRASLAVPLGASR